MKKKVIAGLLAILIVFGSFSLSSCDVDDPGSRGGETVENGLSAYELAVQYGFDGNIEEWIESLHGKSAYEIAQKYDYFCIKHSFYLSCVKRYMHYS